MSRMLCRIRPAALRQLAWQCLLLCCLLAGDARAAWPRPWLPAPEPPLRLFLFHLRGPAITLQQGIPSIASEQGAAGNNDLLAHLAGYGLVQDAAPDGYSSWLLAAADFDLAVAWAGSMALLRNAAPALWLYEIQPGPETYSVYWALNDYVLRNDANLAVPRVAQAYALFTRPFDQNMWALLGSIAADDILNARRWDLDAARRQYRDSGLLIDNLQFQPRIALRQQVNPIDRYTPVLTVPQLPPRIPDHELAAGAAARGTLFDVLPPLGCLPPSAPQRHAGDGLQHCAQRSRPYLAPLRPRPSTLVVGKQGERFCLGPQPQDAYVGVALLPCAGAARFEYDNYRRLSLPWQGNFWCLSAPAPVSGAALRMEPCALNDPAQRWSLQDGRVQTYPGGWALQASGWSLQLTRQYAAALQLQPGHMSPGFFAAPSPPRSLRVELEMAWDWRGSSYFSNYWSSGAWSREYWNRSYYDYRRQTISYVHLGEAAAQSARAPRHYCQSSRQYAAQNGGWNWCDWVVCQEIGPVPAALRWDFLSRQDAMRDPTRVVWRDLRNDPLWVVASGLYPGAYFTALDLGQDYSASSTRHFRIRPDALLIGPNFAPLPVQPGTP